MRRISNLHLTKPSEDAVRFGTLIGKRLLKLGADVRMHPMMGLIAFYRNDVMFAAVPYTRALGSENAVNFKLTSDELVRLAEDEPNIITDRSGSGWCAYEVNSEEDMIEALKWLDRSYNDARFGGH